MTRMAALPDLAESYAETIISAVRREYPNASGHVQRDDADRPTPRQAHPAFYGCFDWHSAVEMHWALARLLRMVPDAVPEAEVRAVLTEHLTPANLAAEADYLRENPGYGRPYGRAWVLTLAAELAGWDDPDARDWAAALTPLTEVIAAAFIDWLPRLTYPDRSGAHGNTAFALARALPWAQHAADGGDPALLTALTEAADEFYGFDADYPAEWEPGGADFLSAALAEAELHAALEPARFAGWLAVFLPTLIADQPASLLRPVTVADPEDGQGAHLHGLNLYRAHAYRVIADALDPEDPRAEVVEVAAERHAAAALPAVVGAGWMAEHWLACYAVLLLS